MRALTLVMLVGVLLSGCAAPAAPASTGSPSTSAPPAVPDADFGSLAGLVVDEEGRPVVGARVQVLEANTGLETDAAGRFTFNNLTPADYRVVVEKLGFGSGAKKAKVAAGEVTELRFTLAALVIAEEPYVTTTPRSAYINVGFYALNTGLRMVNDSTLNSLTCDPCRLIAHYSKAPPPKQIIFEGLWKTSVGGPFVNEQLDIDWSAPSGTSWAYEGTTVLRNRQTYFLPEADVKAFGSHDRILFEIMAALGGGVVIQQKFDFYISFAYHGPAPDGFTAMPPP